VPQTKGLDLGSKLKLLKTGMQGNEIVTPWYLSGGIAAANCLAAYQPKGAANLAASYINLANPGTYNCTVGARPAPDWDITNGWIFDGGTSKRVLNTNLVNANNYSAVVRISNAAAIEGAAFGEVRAGQTNLNIFPRYSNPRAYFRDGGNYDQALTYAAGVLAVTSTKAYANGIEIGTLTGTLSGTTTYTIVIGTMNLNGDWQTGSGFNWSGHVQAIAFYNINIAAYVAAISTAMAAL
jgi:hypothetical protein